MRRKIYRFIRKMFRVPKGQVEPWYVTPFRYCLYPIESIRFYKNGLIYLDYERDAVRIDGTYFTRTDLSIIKNINKQWILQVNGGWANIVGEIEDGLLNYYE